MESRAMEGSSECFVCQYQVSPDGAFLKLPEGYPFKFLCEFLKLPVRAEKLNFSAISNSEFCVACEQIILEAMEVCEKIKDPEEMETQASSLRSYLRNNIHSSYSVIRRETSISASKAAGKFLVQCLSDCKVVIPRLQEDQLTRFHLPAVTYTRRRRRSSGTDASEITMAPIVLLHESDTEYTPAAADSALDDSDPGESNYETSDDDFVTSTGNPSERRAPPRKRYPRRKRPEYYQCRHCERKFDFQKALRIHLKLAHDDVILCTCRYCGLDFKEKCQATGSEQGEEAEKTFMCGLNGCKKAYKTITELRTHHQRKCEENPKVKNKIEGVFICEKCGKNYSSQQVLDTHKASKHEENFKMYCEVCGMGFQRPCQLKTHMIVHSNEKPFECEVCKTRFKRKNELKYHTRKHTGERHYVCEFCGKGFYINAQLTHHKERLHSDKKYPCELCGKTFRTKHYVYKHVTETHKGHRRHRPKNAERKLLNSQAPQTASEAPHTTSPAPQTVSKAPRSSSEVSSLSQEAASVVGQGYLSPRDALPNEGTVIAETPQPPDPRFLITPTPVMPELFRFRNHIHALSSVTHPADNPQPSYSFHKFC